VILFQDVIEILRWAVLAIVGQIACGLQPGLCRSQTDPSRFTDGQVFGSFDGGD
jgi:hypothetical protein